MRRRKLFYFEAQSGLCCLRITDGCKARGGLMSMNVAHNAPNYATFDHVTPRKALRKMKLRNDALARVQLLACRACNNTKGAKLGPSELADRALALWAAWRAHAKRENMAAGR